MSTNTGINDNEFMVGGTGVTSGRAKAGIIIVSICFPPVLLIFVPLLLYYHFANKR